MDHLSNHISSHRNNGAHPGASVLLPVYNAERYLEFAIRSVLSQSYRDFELLLLNDGCSDNSSGIIERFCKQDARCRCLSWPNRGLVASLNSGIEAARGEILLRMDADDICRPGRFERQLRYLDAHPECVALSGRFLLIDPDGLPIMEMGDRLTHDQIDAGNLSGAGSFICHPAVAMRKGAVVAAGGYREAFAHAEDLDLFLRLAEIGRLANLPELLLDYRQHPDSIGYAKRTAQLQATRAAVMAARRRRHLPEMPPLAPVEEAAPVPADIHRMWGWWALSAKNLKTARKHAFKSLRYTPFSPASLRLLACVARGR